MDYTIEEVQILVPKDSDKTKLSIVKLGVTKLQELIAKYPKLSIVHDNRLGLIWAKSEFNIFPTRINASTKTGWFNTTTKYYQIIPYYVCGRWPDLDKDIRMGKWDKWNTANLDDVDNIDNLLYVVEGQETNGYVTPWEVYGEFGMGK